MHNKTGLLFLCVLVASSFASDTNQELVLPQPDGCYTVGTRTLELKDSSRKRDLLVTFWYPALSVRGSAAPYMDFRTAAALAHEWKLTSGFERRVHTHSALLAPIVPGRTFPVVLLEHGSSVVPAIYTVLAEGLASNGYVVAATNHPPDSLIAVFRDGHESRFTPYWPLDADRKSQGVAIGRFAETVLLGDVRFVLERIEQMQDHDTFWRGHLDLSRVGIVGHSMGGTTAAVATRDEKRIRAGVNLDGSTFPGMNGDVRPVELHKPFLFLMTEEHASDTATHGREYVGEKGNSYYVVIPGSDHMSFTDARLIDTKFSRETKADDAVYQKGLLAAERTRSFVEAFFDKYLKGEPAPSLDLAGSVSKE